MLQLGSDFTLEIGVSRIQCEDDHLMMIHMANMKEEEQIRFDDGAFSDAFSVVVGDANDKVNDDVQKKL